MNETKEAGSYQTVWNAGQFASGVYFYRLQAGNYTAVKKLVLMK
ncbi:MAG TPA: T9SS type A sorting domain-containing protein [Bacteroidota bacterium]|nr:T9SS type A sorting domain-containing protein [Bacteroidota bacterium]